jgi:MFS family permease
MAGGTLPIPLYVFWAPQMGFGPFTTTLIFATYAFGVVLALMVFASLSDMTGRRPMMMAAVIAMGVSTGLFLIATDVGVLLLARFIFGLATGIFAATATAALSELAGEGGPKRASAVSTAANMGGLGLGSVAAGLIAQWGVDPTHLVFWIYLASLGPAALFVALVPETVAERRRPALALRLPTLPDDPERRGEFLRSAALVFAAFAVTGMFSSLVPSFLRTQLHLHNVAAIGGEVALLFLVAMVAQLVASPKLLSRGWPAPTFLLAGVTVFETGLLTRSLPTFMAGTVLAGIGIGLAFRRGIGVTQELAAPSRRADLLSTYFLAAYAGLIVPTLALGLLDQALSLDTATLVIAIVIIGTTIAAATTGRKVTEAAARSHP